MNAKPVKPKSEAKLAVEKAPLKKAATEKPAATKPATQRAEAAKPGPKKSEPAKPPSWKPSGTVIEAIVRGDHADPFAVLGTHPEKAGLTICVLAPEADHVQVVDKANGNAFDLENLHPDGLFACNLPDRDSLDYHLRLKRGDTTWDREDAYRFPSSLGEMDLYLMAEGSHLQLYERLGAHCRTMLGVDGVAFAVWAPNAKRVSIVGDFNGWDGRRNVMRKHPAGGLWDMFIPGVGKGCVYKFEILGPDGRLVPLKADPIAFATEHPPKTAAMVHGAQPRIRSVEDWAERRKKLNDLHSPMSIYEVHLGSWRKRNDGAFLTYDEIADQLIPYVQDLGFTHLELMPVSEFPFDGSWGYQPVGLYAPTSRFGGPEAFARFVDRCHQAGIGVIVDWVAAHFPSDPHGLARFDGTALYEHEDPRRGFHKDWNTLIFNYGRREVSNFLLANALYWFDRFDIDGIRADAVASMLYLDYSRNAGEWLPNEFGGNENLEAISFLKRLNELIFGQFPGATSIAEESTAWPGVSRPTYLGGLGFGYKWNMGWMHDTLDFMTRDPIHRRYHYNQLTFGLIYAFSENFVLPLSHDEVVHGKGSLIGRMPGDQWQRFANLRAYFGFMWTHPGKKLLFMGGEFAQEREWSHDGQLDWHHLDDPMHRGVQSLIRDLNHLYRETPSLHAKDTTPDGFSWVEASDWDQSVLAYIRQSGDAPPALVVSNFTPVPRHKYRLGVPVAGHWAERMNTDAAAYGGSGVGNFGGVNAEPIPFSGRPFSVNLTLPPLSTVVFVHQGS